MKAAFALLALVACRADAPAKSDRVLAPFSCKSEITGKRPNGELRVTFLPISPRDASWEVTWAGLCPYRARAQLVAGRLDDGVLGQVYEYACKRSPEVSFAVSCGPYLGSEVDSRVTGERTERTVRVRIPWTFQVQAPPDCAPPFVTDGHLDEIDFEYASCALLD